jgi:hypothetical protein
MLALPKTGLAASDLVGELCLTPVFAENEIIRIG